MDELSLEWQKRFESVWDPTGEGQYRLGSPGQRLVSRFLSHAGTKVSINEYGSGTGRAVVEILRQPGHCDHPINMVDIATNALEEKCLHLLSKPDTKLTFTHASLWDLPADFPHAEWGYCVDVLMTLPPEKLDAALAEIRRTCDNLFVQVYDWDDIRLGINLTTIKGDADWWRNKLKNYWDIVAQEVSPESAQRYIFICRSKNSKDYKKITVITLTGDRPVAFALCHKWITNQTRLPDQWIVVDDGHVPMKNPPSWCDYIRRERKPDDPEFTLIPNLMEAMKIIKGDYVLFMEDDEYYAPKYIEKMASYLARYKVVGIGRSKYYHLPTGGFLRHSNMDHASLAQTAVRTSFLLENSDLVGKDPYLDIRIWKKVGETDIIDEKREINGGHALLFDDEIDGGGIYVGIKGMPGRVGIGCGHREYKRYIKDSAQREVLRSWIKKEDDFLEYMKIVEKEK